MKGIGMLGRLALVLSVVAGVSYLWAGSLPLAPWAATAWKGAGVALLAVYALLRARTLDGWLIFAVMALGATGDVLLETSGLIVGAVAFLAGHIVAIALYLRNRRPKLTPSQIALAIALPPATVATAFSLPADRAMAPGIALYALGLSLMAALAWISRFSRLKTGLGAVMFVASDLLIFARGGPLAGAAWAGFAVWALYYAGQYLICVGVVPALARKSDGAA